MAKHRGPFGDPRVRHDKFFEKARAAGFAARSVYKLDEIDKRVRLIRPGDRVLDLGCCPGSWLQYAVSVVGAHGAVVGIDRNPLPDTTGIRSTDQARSAALFEEALTRAERLLAPGGAFVGKLFQGPDFDAIRKRMAKRFSEVKIIKPDSSRAQSFEIFLVGRGFV